MKPKVSVWWAAKMCWGVGIDAPLMPNQSERRTVVVAWYQTRDAANIYAARLRKALRGDLL